MFPSLRRSIASRLERTTRKPRRRLRLESLEDRSVPATFLVTNTNDSGSGSFRQAIIDVNAAPGFGVPDRIEFDIPGAGVHTITPLTPFDPIFDHVVIDGYSQPGSSPNSLAVGNNAVLRIALDGNGLASPGLHLVTHAQITIQGLVISDFAGDGIRIEGSNKTVVGNFIGTDAAGTGDQGNTGSGVAIDDGGPPFGQAFYNVVGGDAPEDRNRIAFNDLDGVRTTGSNTLFNQILANEIFDNGGLGIDYRGDGVTPNGSGLLNFPVLTSVVSDEQRTTIEGTMVSFPFSKITVRYFSSATADASGHGEGAVFRGKHTVTTDFSGSVDFKFVLPDDIHPGDVISATATDESGNTSEFSNAMTVALGLHPTLRTLDAIVLDIDGDGLDLGGTTTTNMLDGKPQFVNWVQSGGDDAFLLIDATSLRSRGFDLLNHRGEQITGNTLFRDGLRLKSPDGRETLTQDGWQLLGLLDSNKDGKVNASDPTFQHLKLWVDSNADGAIVAAEVKDPSVSIQGLLVPLDPVGTTDAAGNRNENWPFVGEGGNTRMASNVWFATAGPGGASTAPRVFNWTGSNSDDWYDASNWDRFDVPSLGDVAIIDGVADHGSSSDYVGRIYMYGGTLTGSGDGTFTVARFNFIGGDLDGDGTTEIPIGGAMIFRGMDGKGIVDHRVKGSGLATGRRQYDPIMLDLNGDGLDLSGRVATDLFSGSPELYRWTKANTDDAFLLIDATSLRAAGVADIVDDDGAQMNGDVLFAAGLRVVSPDGQDRIITDGWQLLGAFDSNKDGKINASDPVFGHLKLWVDQDADGTMSPTEMQALSSSAESVTLDPGTRRDADGAGNTLTQGSFTKVGGDTGLMSDVNFGNFARVGVPVVLDGTLSIDDSGSFVMDTGEVIGFSGDGTFENSGSVSVTFGGMKVEDGWSAGSCILGKDGRLVVAGTFEFTAGATFSGNGLLDIDPTDAGPTVSFDGVDVTLGRIAISEDGSVWVGNGAHKTIDGGMIKGEITVEAGSTVTLSGNLELGSGAVLTGNGKFTIGNDAPRLSDVVVAGSNQLSNLTVGENGSLTVLGHLIVDSSLVIEHGGYVSGVQTARERGSGLATGRISGNVINHSGTVDAVLLTIDGDYIQRQGGTLRLEFGISEPGFPSNGQLAVTGEADLAGKLLLSAPVGYSPALGASFTLMTYGNVIGAFDRIDGRDYGDFHLSVFGFDPIELQGAARLANPGNTFTDNDGDIFTVKLTGPGKASVFLNDPDGDGKGPIQHIRLTDTNGRTSRLSVTVKKPKGVVSDGMATIGSIEGTGVGGITATKSNLVGAFGHGIALTGALGGLSIRDILNGTDVTAGGDPSQATTFTAHVIQGGTVIDLGTAIRSMTAASITDGTIRTPRIGSLRVIGDRVGPIAGNFSGEVIVTGSALMGLGSVSISGEVTNGHFNVMRGRVGTFSVGSFVDSSLFAGFVPTDSKQPMSGGGFTIAMWIKSFRVKGTFANSFVAADTIFSATIGNVVTDNGPDAFGLLAHTKFGVLSVTQPKLKLLQKNLPYINEDFEVRIV